MCFDKNSSSSSTSQTTTVNRDERVAADGGATVINTKDASTATINLEDVSPEILETVFNYARGVGQGAVDFAQQTQAQYQAAAEKAATQDTTELMRQMMQLLAFGAVAYFAFQYWGKL